MTSPNDPDRPSEYDPYQPGSGYPRQPGHGSEDPYSGNAPPPQYGAQQPGYGYGPQQPDYGYASQQPPPYGGYGAHDPGQQGGYPGYPGYGGGYGAPQQLPKGMAIAALVLGILALLLFWTAFGGVILGIVAVILGIIAIRKVSRGTGAGRGMAITGLVLGILGLIGGIIAAAVVALVANRFGQTIQECQGIQDQQELQRCIRENLPGQQSLGLDGDRIVIWK